MSTQKSSLDEFRTTIRSGFFKSSEARSGTALKVRTEFFIHDDPLPPDMIKEGLVTRLATEVFKRGLVNLSQMEDHANQRTVFQAEVNVCPPGQRFMNVENETFMVRGEKFTETDIIRAIEQAYPERFI